MVSLTQMKRLNELRQQGWVTVGIELYTEKTPIGGPSVMMNAMHEIIMVFADGTALPLVPYDPDGRFAHWLSRAEELRVELWS